VLIRRPAATTFAAGLGKPDPMAPARRSVTQPTAAVSGQLIRLDRDVEPTMYRCATVSEAELVRLRSIQDVVRLGRVTHVGLDRIEPWPSWIRSGGNGPPREDQPEWRCRKSSVCWLNPSTFS